MLNRVNLASRTVTTSSISLEGDRTKWYWTKWQGQNGTDKMSRTKW